MHISGGRPASEASSQAKGPVRQVVGSVRGNEEEHVESWDQLGYLKFSKAKARCSGHPSSNPGDNRRLGRGWDMVSESSKLAVVASTSEFINRDKFG